MSLTYRWPWNKVKVIKPGVLLDPEQDYNHTKFERPPFNSVCQKANIKNFVNSENMSIISPEYVQKWKIVVYSLSTWLTQQV